MSGRKTDVDVVAGTVLLEGLSGVALEIDTQGCVSRPSFLVES